LFSGCGNGWVAMTFANTLQIMPDWMKEKDLLKSKFVKMMRTLSKLQDKKIGHWYQLPVSPGETGNFIECSCTVMFSYAMSVGIDLKILDLRKYLLIIPKAFQGIEKNSLKPVDGALKITNVCYETCIGDKPYYYDRKVVDGTAFTLGTAIMFYDRYHKVSRK